MTVEQVGSAKQIAANREHRFYNSMFDIVAAAYGLEVVLAELVRAVEGIDEAYIYGSLAARAQGIVGEFPRDVDVLLVGSPDPADVYDIADAAGKATGMEINIRTMRPRAWATSNDPFVATVKSRPLIRIM